MLNAGSCGQVGMAGAVWVLWLCVISGGFGWYLGVGGLSGGKKCPATVIVHWVGELCNGKHTPHGSASRQARTMQPWGLFYFGPHYARVSWLCSVCCAHTQPPFSLS